MHLVDMRSAYMRFTFEIYIVVHCASKRKGIFCKKGTANREKESGYERKRERGTEERPPSC